MALVSALVACGKAKSEDQPAPASAPSAAAPPATVTPDATAKAQEIFALRCSPCHGAEGRGDGAASKALVPPPRNFHDPEWQKSVTDDHIEKIIKYGGAAVGKSPAMPGNPDLNDPAVIRALRVHIRGLAAK
ncbi:MAG: cytochrome c [Kofleriaceae bacterium]